MAHGMYDVADFEQLTSLSSSTALPFTGITGDCIGVRLKARVQDVNMRTDGEAAVNGVGELLYATASPTEYYGDLSKLRFIEAAASAKLNVTYYRAKRPEHVGN